MLEVLPDDRLPKFGPGRNEDGNFCPQRGRVILGGGHHAPDTAARFADAKTDYSQKDFAISQAIGGKVYTGRNGWAIGDTTNIQRHIATFKLEDPLVSSNGVTVRFNLQQHYDETRLLGRFRLYFTTNDAPLDFGMPESLPRLPVPRLASAHRSKLPLSLTIFDPWMLNSETPSSRRQSL